MTESPARPRPALIIAYHYPPSMAVGTQRTLRFVRHLPKFGWRPIVLAPRDLDLFQPGAAVPPVDARDACVTVFRARVWRPLKAAVTLRHRLRRHRPARAITPREPSDPSAGTAAPQGKTSWVVRWVEPWLATPDEQVGWLPAAVIAAVRAVRTTGAEVLYTSGPPHSCHLVALCAARLTSKPWVADFRDPWSRRPWLRPEDRRGLRHGVQTRLEAAVVRAAARVVLNTDHMEAEFRRHYADLAGTAKFVTITNGFDPDDLPRMPAVRPPDTVFTMSHAGSLYRRRDPRPLVHAVASLRDRGLIDASSFRLNLVGWTDPAFEADKLVRALRLEDLVRLVPPVTHEESLVFLAASHVTLIIQPGTDLQVPGKLFEYLQFGRSILALAPPGATADIIDECGLGRVAPPEDVAAISGAIEQYVDDFRRGRLQAAAIEAAARRFDGVALTGRLAALFDALTGAP